MADQAELSVEQMVRNILEAQGVEDAQRRSAGELVFGANLLNEYLYRKKLKTEDAVRERAAETADEHDNNCGGNCGSIIAQAIREGQP